MDPVDELEERLAEARERRARDPLAWIKGLSSEAQAKLATEVSRRITGLPAPIGPQADQPERRLLDRIRGWLEVFAGGDPARARAAERAAWLRGGDPLVYLDRLAKLGDPERAFALARAMTERAEGTHLDALEDFLQGAGALPDGFARGVEALDEDAERVEVEALMRFVPTHLRPQAIHRLLLALRDASPELRFEVACMDGPTRDAITMVEDGDIPPELVVARANHADPRGRALWLGLGARAAAARGDHLGVVRLLRDAIAIDGEDPLLDLEHVWAGADPTLRGLMRDAGLPVGELDD